MITFTKKQKLVLEHRGKNLLVKASAGTGKTTVMINRILELIAEKKVSVSDILVVTFTNAAANEMRTRLLDALNERAVSDEETDAAGEASVSTIHGFCNECVRRYFYLVNVDPNYIISTSSAPVRKETLKRVLNKHYNENDADFARLIDIFVKARGDEGLYEAILKIHEFRECNPCFTEWRSNAVRAYESSFYSETYVSYINKCAESAISDFEAFLNGEVNGLNSHIISCIDKIKPLCGDKLEELIDCAGSLSFDRWKPSFTNDAPYAEEFRKLRSSIKDKINKFGEIPLSGLAKADAVLPLTNKLFDVAEDFAVELNRVKAADGALDFSDLERLTLEILNDEKALREIRERYSMIFIDEYQDVNDMQEAIITRLSETCGFFAVGDIKQSIYGFRQSRPENLLRREKMFSDGKGEVFDLSDNFRSRPAILDFVNRIMRKAMTADFGKCNYENDGMLTFGGPGTGGATDSPDERTKCAEIGVVLTYPVPDVDESSMEADLIAARIFSLVGKTVNGKVIAYRDMAILTRCAKDYARSVYSNLRRLGVKISATFEQKAETGEELKELLSFLRVLNNPLDDISLYGVMVSAIGGYSQDNASAIKVKRPDTDLYTALCSSDDKKALELCALIEKYRFFAQSQSVNDLLLRLIEEKRYDLYVLRLPEGYARLETLNKFLHGLIDKPYAFTLSRFIEYIENDGKLVDRSAEGFDDAVKMMTIHGAKGLEFDVVFIIETHSKFKPVSGSLLIDKEMGVALTVYDKNERQMMPTLASLCLKRAIALKEKEEELRLLYVALTRAKHYLFVLGLAQPALREPTEAACMLDWVILGAKAEEIRYYDKTDSYEKRSTPTIFQATDEEISVARTALSFKYPHSLSEEIPAKLSPSRLDVEYEETESQSLRFVNEHTSTDLGTAYHKLIQELPFSVSDASAQAVLDSLVREGHIEESIANGINISKAAAAMRHPQLLEWSAAYASRREIPFIMRIPYSDIYPSKSINEPVLMQGIIDLLFFDRNSDTAIVVDYKFTAFEQTAVKRYSAQIAAYARAVKKILKTDNVKSYIYSIISSNLIPM